MSVYMTFFAGTVPLGAFLAGAIADWFGPPASLAFGGTITVIAAIGIALYFEAWRPDSPAVTLSSMVTVDSSARQMRSGSRD